MLGGPKTQKLRSRHPLAWQDSLWFANTTTISKFQSKIQLTFQEQNILKIFISAYLSVPQRDTITFPMRCQKIINTFVNDIYQCSPIMNKKHGFWGISLLNTLNVKPTKWSNTLKQFIGNLPTYCLSVFGHFVGICG